jgi:hypothetical protein
MSKYDDASWHYGGDYPKDLPLENGATHIGMFLAWCILHDLISDELAEISPDELSAVKERKMTGNAFLMQECDGKFWDIDLSDKVSQFADDYYGGESDFAKTHGNYFDDYGKAFGDGVPSLYHVEDTWENYDIIAARIDEQYSRWRKLMQEAPA